MTIPIRNLYYIFLYAWDRFPAGRTTALLADEGPDLPNLLAKLLASETTRLLRRGMDRGYVTITSELVSPRGRLRIDRMIKEASSLRNRVVCDYDLLTHDILPNQIIKATLRALGDNDDVQKELRHQLQVLKLRLFDVGDINLRADHFRRLSLPQNDRAYGFLMKLCEFVLHSLLPGEGSGAHKFKEILDNEVRMSKVFESFLRNFYETHYPAYRVKAESTEWHVSDALADHVALLPRMITDVTLRHPTHTVIIEAKFYRESLVRRPYGERVWSSNLYQLITYLQHERVRHPTKPLAGMLLYPDVGRSLRLRYRLLDIPILVATVDLDKSWSHIDQELRGLLEDRAAAARIPSLGEPITQAGPLH